MEHRPTALATGVLLGLSALGLFSCGRSAPAPAAEVRPNLVLIVADALRRPNVSLYGYPRKTTPHLDAFAAEGYVFDQAVSVGGNTPTAMSALMTGRYPFFGFDEEWTAASFGMRRFYADGSESGLPRHLQTLAERLAANGYTTAGFITNPYLKKDFNFDRGFAYYREIFRDRGIPYGRGEDVSRAAVEFLRSGTAGRPFFLYLHYMDTHGPYWPPAPYRAKFAAGDRRLEGDPEAWRRWENQTYRDEADATALARHFTDLYDGAVAYVDDCIGQVLEALEEMGLTDEAVIAVTADHGEEFLEHGGTTHKGTLYEELVRVPLLLRIPGKEGGRIADLVRNFDLMPTFLEAAAVEVAGEELDAVSLLPLIDGGVASLRLSAYAGFPTLRMLRTASHKLLHFRDGRKAFYDLRDDPAERRNLLSELATGSTAGAGHPERVASMENVLAQMVSSFLAEASAGTEPPPEIDPKTEEQLKALGYLD